MEIYTGLTLWPNTQAKRTTFTGNNAMMYTGIFEYFTKIYMANTYYICFTLHTNVSPWLNGMRGLVLYTGKSYFPKESSGKHIANYVGVNG